MAAVTILVSFFRASNPLSSDPSGSTATQLLLKGLEGGPPSIATHCCSKRSGWLPTEEKEKHPFPDCSVMNEARMDEDFVTSGFYKGKGSS